MRIYFSSGLCTIGAGACRSSDPTIKNNLCSAWRTARRASDTAELHLDLCVVEAAPGERPARHHSWLPYSFAGAQGGGKCNNWNTEMTRAIPLSFRVYISLLLSICFNSCYVLFFSRLYSPAVLLGQGIPERAT